MRQIRLGSRHHGPVLAAVCVCGLLASASTAQAAPAVYVANGSAQTLSQFDAASGPLTPLSPSTAPCPSDYTCSTGLGFPGMFTPSGVTVSPDGKSAYVVGPNPTDAGPDQSDYELFQYDVASDGTLTPKSPASVPLADGLSPSDVVVTPDGQFVYVNGNTDTYVQGFTAAADGTLSPLAQGEVGVAETGPDSNMEITPDGRSLIIAGFNDFVDPAWELDRFTIGDDGSLTLAHASNIASLGGVVALSPDGRNLYLTGNGLYRVPLDTIGAPGLSSSRSTSPSQPNSTPATWRSRLTASTCTPSRPAAGSRSTRSGRMGT